MKRTLLMGTVGFFAAQAMGAEEMMTLGNYGQALEATSIYRMPTSKSKPYTKIKAYQYLVVRPHNETWIKVMMANYTFGYVRASKVAVLPEEYKMNVSRTPRAGAKALGTISSRAEAARAGLNFIGTPYVWGGNDINKGIDCSAFVKTLYGEIGIKLPRTAAEQARVGQPIKRLEDLRAGDRLYFWEKKRNTIGHTGMYLGNGYFVHSSRGHNGVNTDRLTEKWQRILVAARR